MKTKSFSFVVAVWCLSLGGTVQAQQEKGQGDMAGAGHSPSEFNSYMGGKEHYLPDSPNYMAGKEHYLRGGSFLRSEKMIQGNEQIPASDDMMASGERKKPDDQGGTQVQVEINIIPGDTTNGYEIIYLPVIHPKHHRGAVSPPPHVDPNAPQMGNFHPSAAGGFRQGTMNFR